MAKRNQPCPCGSNLKYKKCCGISQTDEPASSARAYQLNIQEDRSKENPVRETKNNTPESAEAYYNLGCSYVERNMLKDAVASFQKAISLQAAPELYYNLAVIQERLGNSADAIKGYQEAFRLRPDLEIIHLPLANLFLKTGNFQEAISCYGKALSYAPNNAQIYNNHGVALKEINRLDEAADNFRKAQLLEADYDEAYVNLGVVLNKQGKPQEAIACYQKALTINPLLSAAHLNLGTVHREQKQYEEAIACFRKSLSIKQNCPNTLNALGIIYKEQRKYKEASELFHKAVSIDPEGYEAIHNLGVINQEQGEYEEAAQYFQKALSINPEYVESLYGLGVILKGQTKLEEATAYFNKALAIKQDFPLAQTNLAIISWVKGDWDACRTNLDLISNSNEILIKEDTKFVVPYRVFLAKLLEYRESNATRYKIDKNLPVIYVVGDSHCLSIANTTINFKGVDNLAVAKIVIGCKAWHLGNNEKNSYKYEFEKTIESIPAGATTILMFGEIDCRLKEGIIKSHKKNNTNLTESIITLVDNYFNFLLRVLRDRNISPIICNVPANDTEQDTSPCIDQKLQKKVLAIFNQALEANIAEKQIVLLDVYTFSKIREKGSGNQCHIDGNHLLPSVFEHLIRKL